MDVWTRSWYHYMTDSEEEKGAGGSHGFPKLIRIRETDLSRVRDTDWKSQGREEIPGMMYVSDRSADSN